MAAPPKHVPLGLLGAPHGVHGELRLRLWNPDSELLLSRPRVEVVLRRPQAGVGSGAEERVCHVVRARRSGPDYLLLALEGVSDRDAAAALRGAELCVARAALPPPAPGELYLVDLVGLRAERPDATPVGVIEDVQTYPASSVLVVRTHEGVLEIPLTEPYFVEADVAAGRVVVDQLDDLELLRGRD